MILFRNAVLLGFVTSVLVSNAWASKPTDPRCLEALRSYEAVEPALKKAIDALRGNEKIAFLIELTDAYNNPAPPHLKHLGDVKKTIAESGVEVLDQVATESDGSFLVVRGTKTPVATLLVQLVSIERIRPHTP